jgi:hypothetical protein
MQIASLSQLPINEIPHPLSSQSSIKRMHQHVQYLPSFHNKLHPTKSLHFNQLKLQSQLSNPSMKLPCRAHSPVKASPVLICCRPCQKTVTYFRTWWTPLHVEIFSFSFSFDLSVCVWVINKEFMLQTSVELHLKLINRKKTVSDCFAATFLLYRHGNVLCRARNIFMTRAYDSNMRRSRMNWKTNHVPQLLFFVFLLG